MRGSFASRSCAVQGWTQRGAGLTLKPIPAKNLIHPHPSHAHLHHELTGALCSFRAPVVAAALPLHPFAQDSCRHYAPHSGEAKNQRHSWVRRGGCNPDQLVQLSDARGQVRQP